MSDNTFKGVVIGQAVIEEAEKVMNEMSINGQKASRLFGGKFKGWDVFVACEDDRPMPDWVNKDFVASKELGEINGVKYFLYTESKDL